ncbi:hypothetical protein HK096_007372, partial [Nowakowskiella sp. JEL0078]
MVILFCIFLSIWSSIDRPLIQNGVLSSVQTEYSVCINPKTTFVGLVIMFACMAW